MLEFFVIKIFLTDFFTWQSVRGGRKQLILGQHKGNYKNESVC